MKLRSQLFGRLISTMSILLIGVAGVFAQADEPGPFERLFRAMRRGINESQHKSTTHHSSHKQQTSETQKSSSNDANAQTATQSSNKPPNERNTRTATRASAKKGEDIPYGTPVPGKQGFVTSPFSPNSGYVDVRGFAPGTPVKDPYSGKIFLTP
jgi:hypothetical protein